MGEMIRGGFINAMEKKASVHGTGKRVDVVESRNAKAV
jgi:hypothetical protein